MFFRKKKGFTKKNCLDCNPSRPYLKVNVLGKLYFGLLDSGVNKSFAGSEGWKRLEQLYLTMNKIVDPWYSYFK